MSRHNSEVINALKYKESIYDWLYLLILAFFFAEEMLKRTMFIYGKGYAIDVYPVLAILIILTMGKLLLSGIYSTYEQLFSMIFIVISIFVWNCTNFEYYILWIPFLVIGAKGISFDKIVLVHLITTGTCLCAAFVASQAGVIENLAYEQIVTGDSVVRYAFGTTYPTTFSEGVFSVFLSLGYLLRKKFHIWDILPYTAVGISLMEYCHARTDAILIIMTGIVFYLHRVLSSKKKKLTKILSYFAMIVLPALAVLSVILTLIYDSSNPYLTKLDYYLNGRLNLGSEGLSMYGLSVWGQQIKYKGTGGTTEPVTNYFNLDNSYIKILLNFGIIFFILVLSIFVFCNVKAMKSKNYLIIWVIALIALEAFAENRLIEPQYNVFLLVPFSKISNRSRLSKAKENPQGEI